MAKFWLFLPEVSILLSHSSIFVESIPKDRGAPKTHFNIGMGNGEPRTCILQVSATRLYTSRIGLEIIQIKETIYVFVDR